MIDGGEHSRWLVCVCVQTIMYENTSEENRFSELGVQTISKLCLTSSVLSINVNWHFT